MTVISSATSPGVLLRRPLVGSIEASSHLSGFGGFHGGLALGLLTAAMQAEVAGLPLRTATARYRRPLDGLFRIEITPSQAGRTVTTLSATAVGAKGPCVEASAVFGAPSTGTWPVFTPQAPDVPPPQDLEVFSIPPEFVAIAAYTEIRPVGAARPYAGGADPELTAWIRLVEDDEPPDAHRFVFLMDGLAPSYAAVLSTLALVPTIELTVRPSFGLAAASSPWVLLRATTTSADAGGWTEERIDAWGVDGDYLGCAHQLRVVRTN
jgi:Thioesterase-like superfamily